MGVGQKNIFGGKNFGIVLSYADLYLNREYVIKYNEIINAFISRGVAKQENGIFLQQ